MKVFLIILGIVAALFVLFMIFAMKSSSRAATNINPITSIGYGECMGFRLGDRWDFVLSRMKHVGLITSEQQAQYVKDYKEESAERKRLGMDKLPGGMSFEFIASPNMVNIENIEFHTSKGELDSIIIKLTPEQTTIEKVEQFVNTILTAKFRKQPIEIKDKQMNLLAWNSPNYDSIVNIDLNNHSVLIASANKLF